MDSKYKKIVDRHRDLKEGYDKLHHKTVSGPGSSELNEPRVEPLWKMALTSDFSPNELKSLLTELKHYEKRIEKLNHIQAEYILKSQFKDKSHSHVDKDTVSLFEDKIKRHERVVEKMHADFEDRLERHHSEL